MHYGSEPALPTCPAFDDQAAYAAMDFLGPSGLDLLIEVAHDVALRRGRLREAVVVPRGAAEVVGSCAYELNVARLMMHALSVQVGTDKRRQIGRPQ